MPKPIHLSARRTGLFTPPPLFDEAEAIVVRWIAQEDPPPATLADVVQRFRILDVALAEADKPDYDEADRLYHVLVSAALLRLRVHFEVGHQARYVERRDERRMTLVDKMNRAIAQWREVQA